MGGSRGQLVLWVWGSAALALPVRWLGLLFPSHVSHPVSLCSAGRHPSPEHERLSVQPATSACAPICSAPGKIPSLRVYGNFNQEMKVSEEKPVFDLQLLRCFRYTPKALNGQKAKSSASWIQWQWEMHPNVLRWRTLLTAFSYLFLMNIFWWRGLPCRFPQLWAKGGLFHTQSQGEKKKKDDV